jgi:hypothetical protein
MSTSIITVGGNSVNLVALPSSPALRSVQFQMSDGVGIVESEFTGQVQAQQWPGKDLLSGTMTLPPLKQGDADVWIAFLMELRGMMNAFQIGDPLKASPRGAPSGTPLIDSSQTGGNAAMSQSLTTKGWTASKTNLLLPGDWIQIGYRMHRVLGAVNSDASGNATISIWPSLREVPTDGGAVITSNAKGLFRLAKNQRGWSADYTKLSSISFPIQEYR